MANKARLKEKDKNKTTTPENARKECVERFVGGGGSIDENHDFYVGAGNESPQKVSRKKY